MGCFISLVVLIVAGYVGGAGAFFLAVVILLFVGGVEIEMRDGRVYRFGLGWFLD